MKRTVMVCLMTAMCMGSSMTALAAPETMPDGAVFDAEYYAEQSPDVVAVLGTERDALYQHYVTFGKNEGRLPYSPDAQIPSDTTSETLPDDELPIEGVLGAAGAVYQLPTWSYGDNYSDYGDSDGVEAPDGMKIMTVQTMEDDFDYMNELSRYTVPGYEWRSITLNIGGEYTGDARWWPTYNYRFLAMASDDWETIENPDGLNMYQFKIIQDGTDYTQCRFVVYDGAQIGEVNTELSANFLVPQNYSGNLVVIVRARKPEGSSLVTDTENAVTYVF